jgi:hypothetical protein
MLLDKKFSLTQWKVEIYNENKHMTLNQTIDDTIDADITQNNQTIDEETNENGTLDGGEETFIP